MYFASTLKLAVLAIAATAVAVPTTRLDTREAVCGTWYDNYLGPGSAGDVLGTGQCQQIKKAGEGPNDQSSYIFNLKGACVHCDFYRYVMGALIGVASRKYGGRSHSYSRVSPEPNGRLLTSIQ